MKKILVVRNDKIGDFMLAWPSFAMLKASLPDCQVTALVPAYTVALAKRCPWIDHVMVDPTQGSSTQEKAALVEQIKAAQFDASINLFSTTYNAKLVWKAKIPYRLAPATKFAQIFYNHRVRQKRSQSLQPEYEYNLDLIRAFITHLGKEVVEPSAPYLSFNHRELEGQKAQLAQHLDLNLSNKWVFVHAGSGGSANNLSLEQYAHLISGMTGVFDVVLTAGPGEEQKAIELKCLMESRGLKAAVYSKNDGLVDFSRSIACADLFIAGSTGPLHIAAAIDIPTVGFFPSKRSATPLRWKPINSEGRHIAFCPPKSTNKASQENMARIDVEQVIQRLAPWAKTFLSL
ncbi:glycosyltransferase family 9 protein [Vibrio ostreicida]|uniref:Glycosyltransferase family 9 protein n=1 Tax=Vibrio ostreicida TaxID=526588 RepID=A0ABT8BQI0_9VIBR|nr:glycosyltransferase family 9 protein [Vibrio ostreicida]MDN3608510.1 glycosyltransferase family 9 protein [Vibrio ostreicida]NPD10332.1 glycosyltransferase family 9 protein [Vibrio ostreicida]